MPASSPLKTVCCYGCKQNIRLPVKSLCSIFAQVFRCVRSHRLPPGQSTRNFGSKLLLKTPIWSPFLHWKRGQGRTQVIPQASDTSGIPMAYCFHWLEKMPPPSRREGQERMTRLTLVRGHDKGRALLVSSSLSRKSQRQGLVCSPGWSSI